MKGCSNALHKYQSIHKGISRCTVQVDLETMRSNRPGYEAPMVVTAKGILFEPERKPPAFDGI